jgi:hypothetical protein
MRFKRFLERILVRVLKIDLGVFFFAGKRQQCIFSSN